MKARDIVYQGKLQLQAPGAPAFLEFDYTTLPESTVFILNEIVNDKSSENRYFISGHYHLHTGGAVHRFNLQTSMCVNRDKYGNVVFTFVSDKALNKGGTAEARIVFGKVVYRYGKTSGYRYEDDQGKSMAIVRKINLVKPDEDNTKVDLVKRKAELFDAIEEKYNELKRISHLRLRCPTLFNGKQTITSCQIMRRFKGVELGTVPKVTFGLRNIKYINIMLAAVRAVKEQVFAYGKLHKDIKPENMIVSFVNGRWVVNMIDFEFAINKDETNTAVCGTFFYIPMEGMKHIFNEKTEIYSLCMALINFICPDAFKEYFHMTMKQASEKLYTDKWVKKADFSSFTIFPEKEKAAITATLQSGIDVNPSLRPDMDLLIKILEDIKVDIQVSDGLIPQDKSVMAYAMLQPARECRAKLDNVLIVSDELDLSFVTNNYIHLLSDPLRFKLFIDYLGMPCLDSVTSKDEIVPKLYEIEKAHKVAYYNLKLLHEELTEMHITCGEDSDVDMHDVEELPSTDEEGRREEITCLKTEVSEKMESEMKKLDIFIDEMERFPKTFDGLVKRTSDINRKFKKCEEIREYFEDLIGKLQNNKRLRR